MTTPPLPINHNHVTRNVKPYGQCPGCDHYWLAQTILCCDLCGDPQFTIDKVMILELGRFDEPELINDSPLWGICHACAESVFVKAWDEVVERSEERHAARGEYTMIRTTMPALRKHAEGKTLRPALPTDFKGTP